MSSYLLDAYEVMRCRIHINLKRALNKINSKININVNGVLSVGINYFLLKNINKTMKA